MHCIFVVTVESDEMGCSFVYAHCHVEDSNDWQNGPHTLLLCTKRYVSGGALVLCGDVYLYIFGLVAMIHPNPCWFWTLSLCVNGCSVFSGRSSSSTC